VSTQEAQQGGAAGPGRDEAPGAGQGEAVGPGQGGAPAASAPGEQEPSAAGQPGRSGAAGAPERPSEEQMRAAYEAELSRITSADMVLQATVSLLNIGARRLGLVGGPDPGAPGQSGPERDLEQVRDAIDAVRGLMPVVERRAPQEARPLRDALSQLQMAYARESQSRGAPAEGPAAPASPPGQAPTPATPTSPQPQPGASKPGPGPAESSGRLWVPGR
jgi:hypothetical protein